MVFLGPGGVGKTTISAACAMQASRERRTLAVTVDPARRLADAMGMRLGNRAVQVQPGLDAAMLDTKQALDELVAKYAPSPELLQRILASPFYAQLSDAFAGSEEFVSAGKVYEHLQGAEHELIVVDTPPSVHALDFLEVPERLVRVFDSGAVQWLFKPSRVLRVAGGRAASWLAGWTDQAYLEDVAAFFLHFDRMFLDMEQRVRAMRAILTDPAQTAIVVVATPQPHALQAAEQFYAELTGRMRMPVEAVLVNGVLVDPPRATGLEPAELARVWARGLVASGAAQAAQAEAMAEAMAFHGATYRDLAASQQRAIADLATRLPSVEIVQVPALPETISSLDGLGKLRVAMFGP